MRRFLVGAVLVAACTKNQAAEQPSAHGCSGYRYQGWVYGPNVNAFYAPSWEVGEVEGVPVHLTTVLESGETLEFELPKVPSSIRRTGGSVSVVERVGTSDVVCGPGGVSRGCRIEGGHWPNADSVALAGVTAAWRVRVLSPDGGVLLERPAAP